MDLAALLPHIAAPLAAGDAALESAAAEAALEANQLARDEELRAQLTVEFDQRMAEQAATHQQEMEAARREWCETEAAQLAASISAQVESVSNQLADAVSHLLLPLLDNVLQKAAIADLRNKVQQAAGGDLKAAIKIEGPPDLIEHLSKMLAMEGFAAVEHGVRESALQVRVGESRLVSQLPEWLENLKEKVHG